LNKIPSKEYSIRLVAPTFKSNVDPQDLDDETLTLIENLEESGKLGQLTTRKGIVWHRVAPTEIHEGQAACSNMFGMGYATFSIQDEDDATQTVLVRVALGLASDDSEDGVATAGGELTVRGLFVGWAEGMFGIANWRQIVSHFEMELIALADRYSTQLGSLHVMFGFATQGYPIDGHKIGYSPYDQVYFMVEGSDAFGTHIQMGLGSQNNRTYPLMLQFINRPATLGEVKRNTGFFEDRKGYPATFAGFYKDGTGATPSGTFGWYFSKAAPTAVELARNFNIELSRGSLLLSGFPSIPPGIYTYYVSLVLDGKNETEPIWQDSTVIERQGNVRYHRINLLIHTRYGIYGDNVIKPDLVDVHTVLLSGAAVQDGAAVIIPTAVAHDFEAGQKVTIENTTEYNGSYKILSTPTTSTFRITFAYIAETFTGNDHAKVPVSNIQVGAWEAFCKRITHIKVYRKFQKGTWYPTDPNNTIDNKFAEEAGYVSHPPRLLATIPINNTYYKYLHPTLNASFRDPDYVPDELFYTIFNGGATVKDITDGSGKIIFPLSVFDATAFADLGTGLWYQSTVVIDRVNGESMGLKITGANVGLITIDANDVFLPLNINFDEYDIVVGDVLDVRIGSAWTEDTGTFEAPGYTPEGHYSVKAFDDKYDQAAGETGFIPQGTPMRPNWVGKVVVGEQSFVWDIWEDLRSIGGEMRRWTRRLRYTTPHEGVYPTVFYRGFLDVSGDEVSDPIQVVAVVDTQKEVDVLRALALILGIQTARIMRVTNGESLVEDDVFIGYGIAGKRAWCKDGNTIYGLNPEGIIWRYTLGTGFEEIGSSIQDQIVDNFSATEISRAQLLIDTLDNGDKVLWIELNQYDADAEVTLPQLFPETASSDCETDQPEGADFYADSDGKFCFSPIVNGLFNDPSDLAKDVTTPTNFGIKLNLNKQTFSKRTSIDSLVGSAANLENYKLIMGTKDPGTNRSVWWAKVSSEAAGVISTALGMLKPSKSAVYYEDVASASDKRRFKNELTTKDLGDPLGGGRKQLNEFDIYGDGTTGAAALNLDAAAAVSVGGTSTKIAITGHATFSTNDYVVISGTINYDNDGIPYKISATTADTITIPATYVAETFTGNETAQKMGGLLTTTLTEQEGSSTSILYSGFEKLQRIRTLFSFDTMKAKLSIETTTSQTTPYIFRFIKFLIKYFGARS